MIYFIRSGEFVKIGHCVRDPIRRLEKLQVGNPVTLELIGLCEGERCDELAWHGRFGKLRVRGEWFRLEPKLFKAIKPHLVDHDDVSRLRPTRMINGCPGWKLEAYINAVASGAIPSPFAPQPEAQSL